MSVVQFTNVSKRFLPANDGVIDVSFLIDPGEFVFITGPSGAGKTTLMRLMTREYIPTEGEIYFDDEDIVQLTRNQLPEHRRRIGVVYQDYKLVPELNVWENIALPLMITKTPQSTIEQRVTDLLTLVEMANKAQLFPRQLSGGEAQRISIARALALAPTVIFADEPTGNLDPETTQNIVQLLHKINSLGTTIFLATHDQQVLAANPKVRIIRLNQGALESDSHQKKGSTKKTKVEQAPEEKSKKPTKKTSGLLSKVLKRDTKEAKTAE